MFLNITIFESLIIFVKSSSFLFIFASKSSVIIFSYETRVRLVFSVNCCLDYNKIRKSNKDHSLANELNEMTFSHNYLQNSLGKIEQGYS